MPADCWYCRDSGHDKIRGESVCEKCRELLADFGAWLKGLR